MKLALVAFVLVVACVPASAQKSAADAARRKLPSADKIVGDYLKAAGGKKRLASVADAAYEWAVVGEGDTPAGRATSHLKAPSSVHLSVSGEGGESGAGVTTRVAWTRSADGTVRTLTDAAAKRARLRATLEASRLVDFRKRNLLAVVVGVEAAAGEQAYAVEFRGRDEARVRYLFGASSKLPLEIRDERGRTLARFSDYRPENGVMEPHRAELSLEDGSAVKLELKSVRHNAGVSESVFDAPAAAGFDARALLKEVMEKEPEVAVKFDEYTFTVKHTERELDDKGEAKKETSKVWEVFMAPNGWSIGKLALVDGRPLPPEKAAREEKRVADFLAAHAEAKPPETRKGAGGFQINFGDGMGFGLADLLRACDFVSPRREKFQGREAVVFDFRPRADFHPKNRSDEILSKIVGLVWIDMAEKVIMRIEARLVGDFKIGGGLLLKIAPGAGFAFERRRLEDGYWVPRSYHWNASGKGFLVMKRTVYEITEWDNYKRFRTESGDATLDAPKREP
ncbi:MAG TPA: hypothetical protein VK421_03520 [Pyrinomonadaceae bacterium]|nr:hypothetical protein [Pyrinomonadaceae bacterium]